MSIYRALPVEVEAHEWRGQITDLPASWRSTGHFTLDRTTGDLIVQTPQGPSRAFAGDFVIRGTAGEVYPVPRAIFTYKYEAV